MNINDFKRKIQEKQAEITKAIHRTLPIKIGRKAADHFQDNFRKGGYVNNGLHPWPQTQRQKAGGDHAYSQYGPLLSARNYLYGSIRYVPGDATVTVGTSVPYAAVHNQGATITTHPTVTPKMRKFAWRQFFSAKEKKGDQSPEASKWKALALTKKEKLDVTARIPQRQFIGPSAELKQNIQNTVENEIRNILNS